MARRRKLLIVCVWALWRFDINVLRIACCLFDVWFAVCEYSSYIRIEFSAIDRNSGQIMDNFYFMLSELKLCTVHKNYVRLVALDGGE